MEENAKNYCRLCAELKELGKLLDLQQIVPNLMRLNQPFFAIQDTSLPQKVCLVCVQSLDVCIQFIDSLEKAQNTLLNVYPNNYVDDEPPEPDESSATEEWPPYNLQILVKEEKGNKSKKDTSKNKAKSEIKSSKINETRFDTSSEDGDNEPLSYVEFDKVQSWEDMQWTCSLCDLMLPSKRELIQHSMNTHNRCTAFKCPDCDKKFLKLGTYIFHVRKHCTILRMLCHICFEDCKSSKARILHEMTHLQAPFTCVGCSLAFPTESELDAHVISYSQDCRALSHFEKSVQKKLEPMCNICDQKFESRLKLRQHITSNHRPKQPNFCDQCGKTFANKANLRHHMLGHYNIKDHKCLICPASFRSASSLKNHMIRHKGEKNHSCPECGKLFLFNKELKTHLTIHSGEFPFPCSYCEKSFRLNTQLKKHLRQHTGYKPYKCQVCEREFTDWPNYNKHSVRRHNIDMSKTKRTPQGLIRLAEAFAQN